MYALNLNFEPFPVIETKRLLLREVIDQDASETFFFRSDPEMMKYLDRAPATSIDDALLYINRNKESLNTGNGICWGISLKSDSHLIGTISIWRIVKEHYRAEVGYVLHSGYHKQGIMQEALTAVLEYGFRKMQLHSFEATVNPDNAASIALLERNGFVKEAHFKENYYYDGHFLDSAVYSLLSPL